MVAETARKGRKITGFGGITVVAQRFKQGGRTAYIVAPPIPEMFGLVPDRVDPHVIKDANRRLYESHAKDFGRYLWDEPRWVSGALMVGVRPSDVQYEAFEEWEDAGTLTLPLAVMNAIHIKLVDGQHRRYGARWIVDRMTEEMEDLRRIRAEAKRGEQEPAVIRDLDKRIREIERRMATLQVESIPVILYEESDLHALRQMFSDAAKARTPDPVTVTRFDLRNPFNSGALALTSHPLLQGRVEEERSRLSAGDTGFLITANQLASNVVKTLYVGIGGRVSRRLLLDTNESDVVYRGIQFFDDLLTARAEYRALVDDKVSIAEMREDGNLLASPTLLRVLAGVWFNVVVNDGREREVFTEWLAGVQMVPEADGLWARSGLVQNQDGRWSTPLARAQDLRRAVAMATSDCLRAAKGVGASKEAD